MNTRIKRRRPPVVAVEAGSAPSHLLDESVADVAVVDDVQDPAAEAEQARQAAANARSRAAAAVAEAQAEAERLIEAAQAEATQLELAARQHDKSAAAAQAIADREAETVITTARVTQLEASRDAGAAEVGRLSAEVYRLDERVRDLGAERAQLEQHRVMAVRNDDGESLRVVAAGLLANGELAQARSADLEAASAALSGKQAEVEQVCEDLARSLVRLVDLRRAAQGLPPEAETVAVANALAPAFAFSLLASDPAAFSRLLVDCTPEDGRENIAELLALAAASPSNPAIQTSVVQVGALAFGLAHGAQIRGWVEQVAQTDPTQYKALVKMAFPETPRTMTPEEKVAAIGAEGAALVASMLAGGVR